MGVNVKGVFLGHEDSPARDAPGRWRLHRQHLVDGGAGRQFQGRRILRNQGCVRLFTKATAVQHVGENIRCNSVHPGPITTEMIAETVADADGWQRRLRNLPMGRAGTPEEIAYGVLFLASDESSYMTGSELVMDGGTTAQ